MIKLIKLELKKIGLLKSLVVLFVLTLPLVYIYFVSFGGPALYHKNIEPSQKFYDTVRGEVTEGKYNEIKNKLEKLQNGANGAGEIDENGMMTENSSEYSEYLKKKGTYGETIENDMAIMSNALEACDQIISIEKNRQNVIENVHNNLNNLFEDAVYEIRYNKMVLKRAENLSNLKLMDRTNQYDTYFMNTDYVFYIFPALIILICGIFTKDKESGMMALLKASKEGRTKLFVAKYIAMIIMCIGVTLYFQIINFFGLCISYGLQPEELGYSIRGIRGFDYSMYDYSIIQFILIITFMRILAVVFVATVIMIVSTLSKNTIISASGSVIAVVVLVIIPYYIRNASVSVSSQGGTYAMITLAEQLKKSVCTWALFTSDYFTKFSAINIFNYPVPDSLWIAIISIVSCVVMALIACRIYCGKMHKKK